jgi:hypothetical protein
MATFIEGFAKGFGEARDRSLKREMFLGEQQERKSRAMTSVIPKVRDFKTQVEETAARLEYFESRGLDEKTLNTLYSDRDALDTAYTLLTTEGADWDSETANSFIRSSANTKDQGVSWKDHLNTSLEWFKGLDLETMTPEGVLAGMESLTPPVAGAVEFRTVPKPTEPGLSATRERTWKFQRNAFDERIVRLAQDYVNTLNDKPNRTPAEDMELSRLQSDLSSYGTSNNSTMRIFERFGATTLDNLEKTLPPDAVTGLRENALLFVQTPDGMEFNPQVPQTEGIPDATTLPTVTTKEEWNQLPVGTLYIAPDGNTYRKKG